MKRRIGFLSLLGFSSILFIVGCGGGTSGSGGSGGNTNIPTPNPPPAIASISPTTATANGGSITLTVNGLLFIPTSQIEWNGTALATTYVNSGQLTAQIPAANLTTAGFANVNVANPAPGGGQAQSQVFSIISAANQVSVIPVSAKDIVWDASRGTIYASVPSGNGASGDSVVAINPVTGAISASKAVGSQPNQLALSSDASYLWVGVDGSNAVQRFMLPSLTPDVKIPLPTSETALSIQAAPTNPHTVAILRGIPGNSPPATDTLIYDDATQRSSMADSSGFDSIQWGANDSQLYAEDFVDLGDFTNISVNSSGAAILNIAPSIYRVGFTGRAHYDTQTGNVFADNGMVVNPTTGEVVGSANLSASIPYNGGWDAPEGVYPRCVPDPVQPVLFCLGLVQYGSEFRLFAGQYGYMIQSFNKNTLQLIDTLSIPQATGVAVKLIRWGNSGLAFITAPSVLTTSSPGSIYLIDGSFVNKSLAPDFTNGTGLAVVPVLRSISPQSAPAGSATVNLTVTGSNFLPGAQVDWSGPGTQWGVVPLNTTYVSSTELQATLPSNLIGVAGYGTIFAFNTLSINQTPEDVALFTITPSGNGIIGINLASDDVAWDKVGGLLYAAVWDADHQFPNSIVAINPNTGQVVTSQFAGSDPHIVRTTADGAYVYVASSVSDLVTRFELPELTSPQTWPTRTSPSQLPWVPIDLQPAPGASKTIAVALGDYGFPNPGVGGVTIFDNNVPRPNCINGAVDTHCNALSLGGNVISLQWGSSSSSLYGADLTDFYTFNVDLSGVSLLNNYPQSNRYAYFQPNSYLHFDQGTGKIYNDDTQVINPTNGTVVGTFNDLNLGLSNSVSGFAVPDSSLNRIFLLGQTTTQLGQTEYTIESFNETTLAPVRSTTISNIEGTPQAFIRWGNSGLAIATHFGNSSQFSPGMLYIINDPVLVSPN